MNYGEALEYIHSTLWRGSRLGLTRMRELTESLDKPQSALKFIHIAGTNGKGSTAAMLASILKEAGYRTGMFISPYINSFNERIQINGAPISNEELADVTAFIRPFADKMADKPTEFELVTAIGFEYFKREKCDIVILEVGLGGELDSTNVIDTPELGIITAIGRDHVRELGGSIEDIALAKAGIIKENGDIVIYGENPRAEAVFEKVAAGKHGRLYPARHGEITAIDSGPDGQRFRYRDWEILELSLAGAFQLGNAAVALRAIEVLREKNWKIPDSAVRAGLKKVNWPGRFEIIMRSPVFILDGAHNPDGISAVVRALGELFPKTPAVFLTGVMGDKDIKSIFAPLLPIAKEFVTVTPDNARAMEASALAECLAEMGVKATAAASVIEGVDLAIKKAGTDGIVCAVGSLYMSGEIRKHLQAPAKVASGGLLILQ